MQLHQRALKISETYRRAEAELISILQEMDRLNGFRRLHYRSLFEYAIQALSLSESVAYNLILIARKAVEVPALKEKIELQEIPISQARIIAPILTSENQEEWLEKASTLSKRELERKIVEQFPREEIKARMQPLSSGRTELRMGISSELESKIKRVQDLLSQKHGRAISLEEALDDMADQYLSRHDPLEKAKRAEARIVGKDQEPVPGQVTVDKNDQEPGRLPLSQGLRHRLYLRDRGQCIHRDPKTGVRCTERRWLDFHHLIPVSRGGKNELDNLMTLCKAHHHLIHEAERIS